MDGNASADLTGKAVAISGEKADGHGFQYTENDMVGSDHIVAKSGNTVTIRTSQQMAAACGRSLCTLTLTGTSPEEISTLNFYMEVQKSPLEGVIISDTELPDIIAQAKAQQAAAEAAAKESKSYAVGGTGTRTGEDTDNAMFYAQDASDSATAAGISETNAYNSETAAAGSASAASGSATAAGASATLAESWAVGGTNTRTGEDTNNSEYWAGRSSSSAQRAENEADRAAQYADFVTPHFLLENNRLYIKDDSTVDFLVANNRLYMKLSA